MQPQFPLYIVSKGRADSRLTSKALEAMRVPYSIVIEEQEYDAYAAVIDPAKILILDPRYKQEYDCCDEYGLTKSTGPGPARNFVWDHAVSQGAAWHWVMDDNIGFFCRYANNQKVRLGDGTGFRCMEDFCLRYQNLAMAGPNYEMFVARKSKYPALIWNTRIYSCNLIRSDVPYRWRGRYNEDTDLSLRMLKDRWATVQFNGVLQHKVGTQVLKGGNTTEFYAHEGTSPKSAMQVKLHPDVSRMVYKFGRVHHHVDYRPFRANNPRRRTDIDWPPPPNDYGLRIIDISQPREGA